MFVARPIAKPAWYVAIYFAGWQWRDQQQTRLAIQVNKPTVTVIEIDPPAVVEIGETAC